MLNRRSAIGSIVMALPDPGRVENYRREVNVLLRRSPVPGR
jgi:hypothetical protein